VSPELSVVVPMYDEEAVLPLFARRLRPVLDGIGDSYEVLVVDDGSRDATPVLLERFRRDWPQLRVVRLRANAGHQAALSAGLGLARGSWRCLNAPVPAGSTSSTACAPTAAPTRCSSG
jgi:glycosyltransferase involved in cell wall biosynthesis